ncbi:MAG: hypothetical protein AABW90_01385 [Nanoarchaeota archaeon]
MKTQTLQEEINYKEIEQKLIEQKNKIGLVGGSLKLKVYDEAEQNVSAHITPEGWNIEISVKNGFNPLRDRRQKSFARKKKIENGLEVLLTHVGVLHESCHWELPINSKKGCPYDIYWHDKILEAVKQSLPENKKQYSSYVANAFEDLIINPRCKEFNEDFSGQVLFWDWQGLHCKQEGKEHYTSFYEAFVKLNMHLFGDNVDKSLLKRHYSNDRKIDDVVKKTLDNLQLKPINEKQRTDYLFVKENWTRMASMFTKKLADLLDEVPIERLSAFSSDGGEGEKQEAQTGNGIEQKMPTSEGKEEIAFGRYSNNEKPSKNITNYEQLDPLYKRLARPISVNVEAITKQQAFQISPLTYRAFDEEKDEISKIKVSKLFLGRDGLSFAYEKEPLTINERFKQQRKSFPDFKLVVLDNSGSMKQAPDNSNNIGKTSFIPWGDNSKYHYALLGFYGIENFLQRQGIAQYINHGLSLFSNTTKFGESNFFKLDELRKKALSPEWGGTKLDAKVLTTALKGRESFVLSISDGEIENWSSERDSFKELAKDNYYAHIQIGNKDNKTDFTNDLESWKVPVMYVTSGQELSKLMVNITKDTYKRFTRQ